jgi:hypothetical protein
VISTPVVLLIIFYIKRDAFMIRNKKGSFQSTAVLTVSALTLLVLAVIIIFYVKNQIDNRKINKKNAQEIAEYGMMIALKKIEENPSWTEGFSNIKYKNGYYNVTIEKNGKNTYRAISTGFSNSVRKRIICTYMLEQLDDTLKPKTISWEYM